MNTFQRVARGINKLVAPLLTAPVVGGALSKSMTEITYTGRRSGKTFSLPVSYQRRGADEVIVGVAMPDKKNWWRNFQPGPSPIGIRLDGVDRTGSAVAKTGEKGTAVFITLDPAS
ncbi:nitroreductase/quinone reductase family protein [Gordonia neofelifaecis]|uniref:nitroreductase/quinone reductase family protein n=1 Tax=Gordonia neofelifaecis TaxID=945692 RepID=UPI00058B5093|nr:nitroreductase/quinone reductase family protein [Gordonia neofelifaecis]